MAIDFSALIRRMLEDGQLAIIGYTADGRPIYRVLGDASW
jgi:hypothetical protein